jgi:hypothetical protein
MWFRHSSRRSFLNLERGRSNDWLLGRRRLAFSL